jgi:hypothetical protein
VKKTTRGLGSIYQRHKDKDWPRDKEQPGKPWWIQYCVRGEVHRESTYSTDRRDAVRLLKQRLGEASRGGRMIGPVAEKVTLRDMKEALLSDYRLKKNRSIATAEYFTRMLSRHFGDSARALDITADAIDKYI